MKSLTVWEFWEVKMEVLKESNTWMYQHLTDFALLTYLHKHNINKAVKKSEKLTRS